MNDPITAEARFWPKVDFAADCWVWMGGKNRGYGWFRGDTGSSVKSHRFAYELLVGPVPEGLSLDHLCRNRACVNPDHLEPVTIRENILRAYSPPARNHSKTHCANGHEFTPENTATRGPSRVCRQCRQAWNNVSTECPDCGLNINRNSLHRHLRRRHSDPVSEVA